MMRPITALWLTSVPLTDMAAIMFRRVRRGDFLQTRQRTPTPYLPAPCFTSRQTLAIICAIASSFAAWHSR
ncbi:hypothetical protein O9929_00975 [Vibrio lentus]|nr:hypothetical protein [Vibrio lentus]